MLHKLVIDWCGDTRFTRMKPPQSADADSTQGLSFYLQSGTSGCPVGCEYDEWGKMKTWRDPQSDPDVTTWVNEKHKGSAPGLSLYSVVFPL
jgi:hypothetical protein